MTADEVLAHINTERGTSYRLAGRYAQGESGAASKVVDANGNRLVLKFSATIASSASILPQARALVCAASAIPHQSTW